MALIGALDKTKHFSEFGDPLDTAGGTLTPTQRRAAALLNLSGVTMSAAQLAFTAGVTAGAAAASKAIVLDSSLDIATLHSVTMNGTLTHSGATGVNIIAIPDNLASSLVIKEGSNTYLNFVTTDSGESIASSKALTTTDGVASGTARKVGGTAFVDVATADTVTAATSNNAFVSFAQLYTVPANTIKAGTMVRVRAMVDISDAAAGTDTLTCNIRLGSTSLLATTAVDQAANDFQMLEFVLVGRAAPGAAAAVIGSGSSITSTGGTNVAKGAILQSTNFATSGALDITVQAKWSSNSATTTARLQMLNVEVIG